VGEKVAEGRMRGFPRQKEADLAPDAAEDLFLPPAARLETPLIEPDVAADVSERRGEPPGGIGVLAHIAMKTLPWPAGGGACSGGLRLCHRSAGSATKSAGSTSSTCTSAEASLSFVTRWLPKRSEAERFEAIG
jgi:hypothetical protein